MVLLASSYDQSKWLKAEDVPREKKFRIKNTTAEFIGGDNKEEKLVVWFTNDPRGLVLNKTNNRTIRGAFGDDTAGWPGKIIAIFPTMADFRGTMKPALRVRIPPPKQAAAANPPPQPVQPSSSENGSQPAAVKLAKTTPPVETAPPVKSPPAAPPVHDPELEPDPVPSLAEEMDDDIPFE
jgi:hypothetical protein